MTSWTSFLKGKVTTVAHDVHVRQHIKDRVLDRRGRIHWFDSLNPASTAFVVIDMQSTFCEPGSPAEVPKSRDIIPQINSFSQELRSLRVPIIWVLHANTHRDGVSDWEVFFNNVVSDGVRTQTIDSLAPGRQKVWDELEVDTSDITVIKNRYSAFIPGSSSLERVLRNLGVDTILIGGTKTNVCCESTGRDAMMMDFKTVMVEDCCAALSDDEHQMALENFIQQFGDVRGSQELLELLRRAGDA